ncbi:MAG: Tat pathway signal sequence domain protein [Actinomycetota bacterium]|nr:Tat pathway signal sequence domain protein [Actinomycetota bacterium]
MAGSSMEFWFEFDNFFNPTLGEVGDDVLEAYRATGAPFGISESWHRHRSAGTYPDGFRDEMAPNRDFIMRLADQQLAIFDRHFSGDAAAEQNAFEEFAQGLNFDDRRPDGDKVHKMDTGGPDRPPRAYHPWHAFMRAVVLLGGDEERWLGLNRRLGLAWAIQNEARPADDEPDNQPLPQDRLQALRRAWLGLDADALDAAFDNDPLPPAL